VAPRLPRVQLRKKLARAIAGGHPWIFRDALRDPGELDDGAVVLVVDDAGRALGRGFWTRAAPLAVRMLTTDRNDDLAALVPDRLTAALERRLAVIDRAQTNAFRWVHGEADRLPGVHLDVYADIGALRFDGAGARAFYAELASHVMQAGAALGLTAVVERRRGPRGGHSSKGQADGDDDGEAQAETTLVLAGTPPSGTREVREHGLLFEVDLVHGQKGGLFLDQRDNRARVAAMARGRRVLNLFGYTGGFSVHAAAAGAAATTTVDLSPGAVAAARRNFQRNRLPAGAPHEFVAADAFTFLEAAAAAGRRWDLVISDPPSFAPSQRALPAALRAYTRLHRLCAAVAAPGGVLCAASCSSHVTEAAFVATVEAGCGQSGRRFIRRESHGAGPDHPVADFFPEGRYLKFVVGTVT
jgi:23S rRNA (cytosine1962-C5)-methyltransferase